MTGLIQDHTEIIKLLLASFVCPAAVAAIVYLFTRSLDNWSKRRKCRKLAKARIETYLSDINAGIQIIKTLIATPARAKMPRESWDACKLSDELLLEIIVLKDKGQGFPPATIMIRLKDYFEHVCPNVETFGSSPNNNTQMLELLESSNGVCAMLNCVVCQLESHWWQFWK